MFAGEEAAPENYENLKRGSRWMILVSVVLAAAFLLLAVRGLDWAAFWGAIRFGHYEYLLWTVPIASLNYLVRALRWRILVGSEKNVSLASVFWANMVGYMGNAYLPARAGELLRSVFLGQKKDLGTSFVLGTALVERTFDAVALVLIAALSLLWESQISAALTSAARVVAAASFLVLGIIIAAPFGQRLLLRIIQVLPLRAELLESLSKQLLRFLVGMRTLQKGRRLLGFVLLTAVIWLVDAIGVTIGVRIVSQSLTIGQALILLSVLGLSSAIPSTPGYVGVYQYVAVVVLTPFGFSRADALAFILISQILNYALFGFWGMLGLWRLGLSERT